MKFSKKGFTLIELLVVIAILSLLLTLSYAPYVYYQNKTKLKIASREISQAFYEAKNMAISGLDKEGNKSIGLFIDTKDGNDSKINFLSYNLNFDKTTLSDLKLEDLKIKERKLQDGIMIDEILGKKDISLLFLYESITGKLSIYSFNGNMTEILDSKIPIKFSFKNSTLKTLQKEIFFYPKTNIIDYE